MRRKSKRRVVIFCLLGLCAVGFVFIVGEGLGESIGGVRSARCRENLKRIGLVLREYAADHDERFPPGETAVEVFSELTDDGYLDAYAVYVCPGARDDVKAWRKTRKLTEETCSYEWVAGLTADSPPDFVVVFDRSTDYHVFRFFGIPVPGKRARNVLLVAGLARWMSEDRFQERMKWQREMTKRMKEGAEYVPFEEWRDARNDE